MLQQFDYALEQTAGATAVNAAMIEAQCDLRFGFWNKFFFGFVPRGDFFSGSESEQQSLIGQRNWRAPFHSEGPEIRDSGDAAGLHVWRNSTLSRKLDELLVFCRKIGKRRFTGIPDHWHHDPILGFHRDSNMNGARLHYAISNQLRG